jgi:hypothetical protein
LDDFFDPILTHERHQSAGSITPQDQHQASLARFLSKPHLGQRSSSSRSSRGSLT